MLSKTLLCIALGLARIAFAAPLDYSNDDVQPRAWLLIGGNVGKPKEEMLAIQRRGWMLIGGGEGRPGQVEEGEGESLERRGWQLIGGGEGRPGQEEETAGEGLERRAWLLIGGGSCGWRCAETVDPSQLNAEGEQQSAIDA